MIKETCACGATFEIATKWFNEANSAAIEWREKHQHEMPPAPVEKVLLGNGGTGGIYCGGCRQQLYLNMGGDLRHLVDASPACKGDDDGRTDRPAGAT